MLKQSKPAIADVFFALGDETRLGLVTKLRTGAFSGTLLSQGVLVTRQAVLKHLHVLEDAGLVSHERRGREVLYSLDPRRLEDAQAFLNKISAGWDRALNRLRNMVEEKPATPPRKARSR
ncbi:MAG TPA: metalloregulator ArsR/SmtB family transcription factor [Terracidiphilus sp.]|jgi:DNA-binding transcriptional ArsR family regulator